MLPLLYVANEVLQTSKRNRGNRFLEAFSPVLGSSLSFICTRDRGLVEKVRRTVKIWGDRRIFSMRFVMDVLAGLDSFRGENGGGGALMEPVPAAVNDGDPKSAASPKLDSSSNSDEEDDDDDEDMFGESNGPKLLDVDLSTATVSAAANQGSPEFGAGAKRRRSVTSPVLNAAPVVKKPKALSNQSFLDLFQSIVNLDETYKSSLGVIESIPKSYLEENGTDIDDLVGDELTDMYKKVCEKQRKVRRERRVMYSVAVQRRQLEKESKRYVQWLKNLAKVDDDDMEMCDQLEKKLDVLSVCQEEAKALRDHRREEEAKQRAEQEAAAQREAEEEERKQMLDDVKKQAEAKPGMVWNQQLREYQYLHDPTQESWRD